NAQRFCWRSSAPARSIRRAGRRSSPPPIASARATSRIASSRRSSDRNGSSTIRRVPTARRVRYLEALPPPTARPRGALVLLHAFPLNARMWEPQLALASRGWHVVAPHVRGADGDAVDRPAQSMDDYVADLIDLLDALHVEDVVIGGLSMG